MHWGLLPAWVKDPRKFTLLINARAETVKEGRPSRTRSRGGAGLIPADDGYYEWQTSEQHKATLLHHRGDGSPIGLAGVAETWIGPNGEELDTWRSSRPCKRRSRGAPSPRARDDSA